MSVISIKYFFFFLNPFPVGIIGHWSKVWEPCIWQCICICMYNVFDYLEELLWQLSKSSITNIYLFISLNASQKEPI